MNVRVATRTALVDLITTEIDPDAKTMTITRSFPGDSIKRDSIYIARTEGNQTLPFMESGAHEVRDEFSIFLALQSLTPGQDPDDAETRVAGWMESVITVVGQAQLSGGLAELVPDLVDVDLGEVNGPDSIPLGERTGFQALAEIEITCTAQIFTA